MDDKAHSKPNPGQAASREERLKQALRANLRRRKSQAKERRAPSREGDVATDTSDT